MNDAIAPEKGGVTPCWYVKDFADGWIKFYDVDMALAEAKETGALMVYAHDAKPPLTRKPTQETGQQDVERALEWINGRIAGAASVGFQDEVPMYETIRRVLLANAGLTDLYEAAEKGRK